MDFIKKIFKNTYYFIPVLVLITAVIFTYIKTSQINCNDCNLIIISVDTLRADHMGVYGYNRNTTPYIDKWAKNATVFNNAYTVFPLTAHSFFTLFTGIDRVLSNDLLSIAYATNINYYKSQQSLPLVLAENRYLTGAFVTNQLLGAVYGYFRSQFEDFKFNNSTNLNDFNPGLADFAYDDQKLLTNRAIDWLKNNHSKKFFLWLHYLNPHHPYNAPASYVCKIDPSCTKDVYKEMLDGEDNPETCSQKISDVNKTHEENLYDAEILTTDEQIGLILRELRLLNLEKRTIVVFYGDHGEGFDHDIYHHGNALYTSSVRIPLIIKLPPNKKPAPHAVNALIDNSDIMPTLLNLMGVSYDKKLVTGKSFDSVFTKNDTNYKGKDFVYFRTPSDKTNRIGVTDGRYKYVSTKGDYCLYNNYKEELYDLNSDPEETINIIDQKQDVAKKLRSLLLSKLAKSSFTPEENDYNNTNNLKEKQIIKSLKSLGY